MSTAIYVGVNPMHDVVGRADYISSPERQEKLLAVAGQTDEMFWKRLSSDAQEAYRTSGGAREKTIQQRNKETGETEERVVRKRASEAREIHVILPKNVLELDDEGKQKVADDFVTFMKEKYGVDCLVGLHESKTENNVHLHALFPERFLLPEPQIKIADRNAFLDEYGVRKRTKKEILDADGKLRAGCRIVPKGEVISERYFGTKEEIFGSKGWSEDCKKDVAEWINERLQPDLKRVVYDPNGPYLPQQKVGKGRSAEEKRNIETCNQLVKTFNKMVRDGIISEEEAKRDKTFVLLAPDRMLALSTVLASFTSEQSLQYTKETFLGQCDNDMLDQIERHPGKKRTAEGPNEDKKRELRALYREAAITRQQARISSGFERTELIAKSRHISARIDQLRKELGYIREEEYQRRIEKKEEELRKKRGWILNRRSRIATLQYQAFSKKGYINYLYRQRSELPIFFLTKEEKAEKRDLERKIAIAEAELREIHNKEIAVLAQYKMAKQELKEQKKALRQEKKEVAALAKARAKAEAELEH